MKAENEISYRNLTKYSINYKIKMKGNIIRKQRENKRKIDINANDSTTCSGQGQIGNLEN